MFPQKREILAEVEPKTYPLGEQIERSPDGPAMALVALSHTPVERRLYTAMLGAEFPASPLAASAMPSEKKLEVFTARRVMELTGITSLSTVRRGLEGLVGKFSVERVAKTNGANLSNGSDSNGNNGARDHGVAYRVFMPEDVIARRDERGINTFTRAMRGNTENRSFERVIQRIVETKNLSRREAQVALCCVEGLTNAEIGSRLLVKEQTVKFHLRHIFLKFGVKRRAELISRLLM